MSVMKCMHRKCIVIMLSLLFFVATTMGQKPTKLNTLRKCRTIDDIWDFASQHNVRTDETYFLGSLVAYENRKNIEIIDGQQRVTSIFLLLRAIYTIMFTITRIVYKLLTSME